MFEGSLVESTALLASRNRWPAFLSFTAQAALALVIVAVPMLHPELLPMHAPSLSLVPPPPPHPPQPPPPQHMHSSLASATSAPSAPSAPPAQRSFINTLLPTNLVAAETPIPSGLGPGMTGNALTTLLGNGPSTAPNVTAVTPAPPAHTGLVRLSNGVTTGLLLSPIRPAYPAIAKASRTEGTVIVRAIISRAGLIERAEVLSGPPMLQGAALDAVEQAHYRPYLLNGQPTEVETTVTINFRLGS